MAGKSRDIQWNFDLTPLVGESIDIETKEGHIRTLRLKGVEFHTLQFNGLTLSYPLELIGEDDERLPLTQLISFKRSR